MVDEPPNILHISPVIYNAVTKGVVQLQQPAILFSVGAYVVLLLMHAVGHHLAVLGAAHVRGEH